MQFVLSSCTQGHPFVVQFSVVSSRSSQLHRAWITPEDKCSMPCFSVSCNWQVQGNVLGLRWFPLECSNWKPSELHRMQQDFRGSAAMTWHALFAFLLLILLERGRRAAGTGLEHHACLVLQPAVLVPPTQFLGRAIQWLSH